jgi:hypothetical protein
MLTMLDQITSDEKFRVTVQLLDTGDGQYSQDSIKILVKMLKDLADHLTLHLIELGKAS